MVSLRSSHPSTGGFDLLAPPDAAAVGGAGTAASAPAGRGTVLIGPARAASGPHSSAPIIGRESDLAAVRQLLLQSDARVRVVTLTGPSGIGRTRLAALLRDDAKVQAAFATAPAWVDFGQADAAEPAVALLARALSITPQQQPQRPGGLLEQVVQALQASESTARRLLIIDDADSRGRSDGARTLLAYLLERCPGLQLLLTSHAVIGLPSEHEHRLQPLEVPAERDWSTLSEAERGAAIDLFVQRARHLQPGFSPTMADTIAIARVCRLLGGLPAAVELAAAQIRNLTPRELLAHLGRRAPQDAILDATAALTTVVNWCVDLCGAAQQTAFRRLAIFPSGVDAPLASATGSANATDLAALTTRGLLEDLGGGRYRLAESLRVIARARLDAAGADEATRIHAAQADWYLQWSPRAADGLRGAEQAAWMQQFTTELANLRVALDWLCNTPGRASEALRLGVTLVHFFSRAGLLDEGRLWLQRAVTAGDTGEDNAIPAALRAQALNEESWLAVLQGDSAMAETLALASLHVQDTARSDAAPQSAAAADAAAVRASTLDSLGELAFARGDFDLARQRLHASLADWQAQGEAREWHAAMTRISLGNAELNAGDTPAAERNLHAAETTLGALGDARAMAIARLSRAWLLLSGASPSTDDAAAAQALLTAALGVFRPHEHHLETADTLEALAALVALAGTPLATLPAAEELAVDPARAEQYNLAAQLLGAALALREANGIAPTFLARIGPQAQRRALRSLLLDDALASARARGAAQPLDALLDEVQQTLGADAT